MTASILKRAGAQTMKKSVRISRTNQMRMIHPTYLHYMTRKQKREFAHGSPTIYYKDTLIRNKK